MTKANNRYRHFHLYLQTTSDSAASNAAVETDLIFTISPFSTSHVRSISPFFTSSALRQPFGGASSRPSSSLSASTSHFNSPPPPGDRVPASSVTSANFIANDVSAALTSALSASLGGDGTFFQGKVERERFDTSFFSRERDAHSPHDAAAWDASGQSPLVLSLALARALSRTSITAREASRDNLPKSAPPR